MQQIPPPPRGRIYDSILGTVGATPLVRVGALAAGLSAEICLKLEYFNPCSSIKDRIGQAMIEWGEQAGKIGPGSTLVEATSGNTGIGLAMAAALKGYRLILVMPETVSSERKALLAYMGAEIVLTPAADYVAGALAKAAQLADEIPGGWYVCQDRNPGNLAAHFHTADEVWADCGGKVDAFVAGVGTAGTLTGAGRVLRQRNPAIKLIAVQPFESQVLTGGEPVPHRLTGIGAFKPDYYDPDLVDEVVSIPVEAAMKTAREAARREALLIGISAGAALKAALIVAARPEMAGKRIVAIAPSSAERYVSTDLFKSGAAL